MMEGFVGGGGEEKGIRSEAVGLAGPGNGLL